MKLYENPIDAEPLLGNKSEDIAELRDQTQAKLDAKTDILQWNDMNDDIDASIKTVFVSGELN